MTVRAEIKKHFDYLTPFSEAENDRELEQILRLKYPKACSKLEADASFFARMVDDVQKLEAWRVIGANSFEEFCRDKLGMTIEKVEAIVDGVKRLQARGLTKPTAAEALAEARELRDPGRPPVKVDNVNFKGGNESSYLAARLKRDHPDVVARVHAGEIKSIHAAAVIAGIVKRTATIPIDTAENAIKALSRRFTVQELRDGLDALDDVRTLRS